MPYFSIDVRDTAFRAKVRDLRGRFAQGNQAMRRAHQDAIAELGATAAKNLARKRRRAPDPRHGRLADIVTNPEASTATVQGFQFMVAGKVQALDARIAKYYRVTEHGSHWWMDRPDGEVMRLLFFGPGAPRQAAVGSRTNPRFPIVKFKNPIPAYGYLHAAEQDFIAGGRYKALALRQLREVGIPAR